MLFVVLGVFSKSFLILKSAVAVVLSVCFESTSSFVVLVVSVAATML